MKRRIIFVLLLLICIAGILFSGYQAFQKISMYRKEEQVSQQMQQYIQIPATEPPIASDPVSGTTVFEPSATTEPDHLGQTLPQKQSMQAHVVYPTVDFPALWQINTDIVGWIYIEGTQVNYPILQGRDNREYVETMPNGWYNASGSIFMDYRNAKDFSDRNTILYGHHMQNGSMFADIVKYKDPAFLEAHPIVMIMTPEKNFCLRVIAGYVAALSTPAWQREFASDADFAAWLHDSIIRSQIKTGYIPDPTDTLLTLSTCTYEFSDARFVLVCAVIDDME